MERILRFVLGLVHTIIKSASMEEDSIVIDVRPYERARRRCPVCGKKCRAYDVMPHARRWRALDLGGMCCYLRYRLTRVECPDHGVHTESVPWARPNSRFTRSFEDQVAWLSCYCCRSVVSELMRIDWKTVGPICQRVHDALEREKGLSRYDGLRRIGIDETSYKKGYKYMTVIVDHDRCRVIWAAKGHGKAQLDAFFSLLTDEQKASIEVVTADGAGWIADAVKQHCPNAEQVMDPFHVVSWGTDALDELRRQVWRDARKSEQANPIPKRKRGRPKKGEEVPPLKSATIKGARYPLLKNPENLSRPQTELLEAIARSDPRLYRGYLLKESLRDVFKATDGEEAEARLKSWLSHACRCRIPEFVELSKKVRKRKDDIVRAVALRISNARIEAINNKIKLTIRMGYGFRNIDNLIALVMLRCSDLKPQLPGRCQAA